MIIQIIILGVVSSSVWGQDISPVIISSEQRMSLDKLLSRLLESWDHLIPHEYLYMKQDAYLLRWLQVNDFDIRKAEEMVVDNLKWRIRAKMDTIHAEDWSRFQRNYPYTLKTRDNKGQPLLYFHPGSWDLRPLILTNNSSVEFCRYLDKIIDETFIRIQESASRRGSLSQTGIAIINMGGWNAVQHGCTPCIRLILHAIVIYEMYYPASAEKIFVINTPILLDSMLQGIRRILTPLTKKAVRIYGYNKAEWKAALLKDFDQDQLPEDIGGSFNEDEDN